MKLLAFAATNSLNSMNKKLVVHAADLMKSFEPSLSVDLIDLNDYEMPIYRPDREKENGIPQLANTFYNKVSEADKVLISFAEYNGNYTAAYKNIFDWVSRIDQQLYQKKPVFVMAASPGKRGGAGVLKIVTEAAPYFGMDLKGSFSLPMFRENFDQDSNQIKNAELAKQLADLLKSF
ncbi:MAG: NAD(P)H-dependent oxidoreductase [Pseudomonadota bacterium]